MDVFIKQPMSVSNVQYVHSILVLRNALPLFWQLWSTFMYCRTVFTTGKAVYEHCISPIKSQTCFTGLLDYVDFNISL